MDTLTLTAAAAVEVDGRTITGLVVPWGRPGRTNQGVLSVTRGCLRLPEDLSRVKLLASEHDRSTAVGYATAASNDADGLRMTFHIPDGIPGGDDALHAARHRVRDGLSVEATDLDIVGKNLDGGQLEVVALVAVPAFPDSRVELAASAAPDPVPATKEADPVPETPTAPAPELRAAGHTSPVSAVAELRARLDAAKLEGEGATRTLLAALADIKPSGGGAGNTLAGLYTQALGELWSGSQYDAMYRPLIASGTLTAAKVDGWRWDPAPTVGDYAGEKTQIPSNGAILKAYSQTPKRLAGGHDIDRIYKDLGGGAVIASYWARMTEAYKVELDAKAHDLIVAAGGTATAATSLTEALVKGTLAVARVAKPTFALVSEDLVEEALLTAADTAPLGLTDGGLFSIDIPTPTPSSQLAAGTVIVGTRNAVKLLTFDPPIRLEAVNIPLGGVDGGLFGYYADIIENDAGVVAYTVTATP